MYYYYLKRYQGSGTMADTGYTFWNKEIDRLKDGKANMNGMNLKSL